MGGRIGHDGAHVARSADARGDPQPLDESRVRALVVEDLIGRFRDEPAQHLVVEEFGVGRGASRADVAVISATGIIGVEIKSAADTVRRLAGQVTWYSRVFDAAVLVMDSSHLQHAEGIVPTWWGLSVVDGGGIHVVRAPGRTRHRISGRSGPCCGSPS